MPLIMYKMYFNICLVMDTFSKLKIHQIHYIYYF
jgi:hypothetical protein